MAVRFLRQGGRRLDLRRKPDDLLASRLVGRIFLQLGGQLLQLFTRRLSEGDACQKRRKNDQDDSLHFIPLF
jgi:hypothetical protein